MKQRIRGLGGGLAIATLSARDGDVTQPQPAKPIVQPAAAHVSNARADSAADKKKGRYAMGAN